MERFGPIVFWSLIAAATLTFCFGMLWITQLIMGFLEYNSISGVILSSSFMMIWMMVFYEVLIIFRVDKDE